jgi:molybdopterin molybdotransferase
MIPVKDAESLILDLVKPLGDYEVVDLTQALGRILAEDIYSNLDFPLWHNSAMDGYAFRFEDLQQFATLAIAPSDIPAGSSQYFSITSGECVRIFTGGILPDGADTVVMQEDVEIISDRLHIKILPKLGEYVRQKGEFYQAGTILLQAGIKINPAEIGILASTQNQKVNVYRQPRVSIISTGTELRDLSHNSCQKGQIIDSNQYALSGLLTQAGAVPISMGIVGDRPEDIAEIMIKALAHSDLVISSGGVSVGDYDYVDRVLADLGANIQIKSCAIKPGKPLTVASFNHKIYFGIPGNPASLMVCFSRLIKGAIAKLSGANSAYWYPQYIQAIALDDLHAQGRRETYLWGFVTANHNHWQFQPISNHISGYSSGNLISWAGVNALAILKVNQTYIPRGEIALVLML